MLKLDRAVGDIRGSLLIMERLQTEVVDKGNYKQYRYYFRCKCLICGNLCVKTYSLLYRKDKDTINLHCGCRKLIKTHGMTNTGTYQSWEMMKQRCLNPKATKYESYGGEGITIDERWMSFESFYEDMGDRPEGTTLDRVSNDVGYTKLNCRWATRSVQQFNRKLTDKSKSGHVGVTWCNSYNKWKASISCKNKVFFLGYHKTKISAIKARKEAEILHFGFNIN